MAVMVFAFNINAETTTVYVVGAGDGLTWDLPGKAYTGEDGVVSFTVNNLTKFKASLNNSTDWDAEGGFNAGAYGPGATSFGNTVYPNGQTLPMVSWGEDTELPWTGNYTITMDFNNNQITAKTSTPKPTTAPAVYIRGGMNSWGSPAAWQLTNISWDGTSGVWQYTGTIPGGQEFKIADASWGAINYSVANTNLTPTLDSPYNATYNGGNTKLAAAFTGTVTLTVTNYSGHVATITFSEGSGGPVTPSYPEKLYIIGTINGGAWSPDNTAAMTNDGEGIYTIDSVTLAENGGSTGFAITGGGATWDDVNALRFGPAVKDTKAVVGTNAVDGVGDCSWTINPGTYKMVFDYDKKTLVITGEGGDIKPEPDPDPNAVYVIGTIVGSVWSPTASPAMENEGDGMYSLKNVKIQAADGNDLGYFALTTKLGDWDSINDNRMGPAVNGQLIEEGENDVDGTGDTSWTVKPGIYNLAFDIQELVLDVEYVGALDDTPVDPKPEDPVDVNTIYVVGAGEGLTWDLPGKAYTGTDNVITFTVNNLSQFKVSIYNTTEWDGENGFNAGCYGSGETYFNENEVYPNGQTLPLVLYGENQSVPYDGTYTVTYDFKNMTMTLKAATPPPTEAPTVYIRGGMNDWGVSPDWQFTFDSAKDEYTIKCQIQAGVEFKIADAGWSNINFTYDSPITPTATPQELELIYNQQTNMSFTEDFTGTIVFKSTGFHKGTATVTADTDTAVDAVEAAEEGEAAYYNLQGVRVLNPDKGIFVRVLNGKATKVVR